MCPLPTPKADDFSQVVMARQERGHGAVPFRWEDASGTELLGMREVLGA